MTRIYIILGIILIGFILYIIGGKELDKCLAAKGGLRTIYSDLIEYLSTSYNTNVKVKSPSSVTIDGIYKSGNKSLNYTWKIYTLDGKELSIKLMVKDNGNEIEEKLIVFGMNESHSEIISRLKRLIEHKEILQQPSLSIKNDKVNSCSNISEDDILRHLVNRLNSMGNIPPISEADIQKTLQELNLAPNVPQEDEAYILFLRAKQEVENINSKWEWSKMTPEGKMEALILCSAFLLNLRSDYTNTINFDILEDRYILLLHDELVSRKRNTIDFINSRLKYYNEIKKAVKQDIRLPFSSFGMNSGLDLEQLSRIYDYLFYHPLWECELDTKIIWGKDDELMDILNFLVYMANMNV